MEFTTYFEHETMEREIYRLWEESGIFRADENSTRPAFTISMPPPNATGTLHLGHATMLAIEDLMIRYRRMMGDEVLWLPGTDHAAIATESVVIRNLQKEGVADPRKEFGREGLIGKIAEFVEDSRQTIRSQIRATGASCDWSRERYTMQPELARCVSSVFAQMFRDGLIYRGARLVNWDVVLQTVVSDDEIEHVERQAKFYTLRYGPFLVGTSRPETKLGDTAVVVHPSDDRWKDLVGRELEVNWTRGHKIKIKVIEDAEYVNPEIGTGILGVTPAHSQVDFEIAQKYNLPLVQVIGEDGAMTAAAGPYAGLPVEECRKEFVKDLREAGLLVDEKEYIQPVSICYRSKSPIEPLPKNQWFIDVNKPAVKWRGRLLSLRQIMREVVESGEIQILPEWEKKKYFRWIENLRDWCISRQIWWGHRIPVWYRGEEETYVGHRNPGPGWRQDEDTLDTWFSSALWTWSTLVDPALAMNEDLDLKRILRDSPDFKKFHPTSVMETGYDILFFWVARMILMTTYFVEQVPFNTVYLHGLILDENGDKMSKSKPETCIDPLDVIHLDGADTLRLALVAGSGIGRDTKLGKEHIQSCKRMINKLWNASKLVQATVGRRPTLKQVSSGDLKHPVNRWMNFRMNQLIRDVSRHFENYQFNDAVELLRAVFWNEFCDFYLEAVKVEDLRELPETVDVLDGALNNFLLMFHPFIPFVTETIWQTLGKTGLLIAAEFPSAEDRADEDDDLGAVTTVNRLITSIRAMRADLHMETRSDLEVAVQIKNYEPVFRQCLSIISRLARVSRIDLELVDSFDEFEPTATVYLDETFVLSANLTNENLQGEYDRVSKQLTENTDYLLRLGQRLQNQNFLEKAKPEIIESTRNEMEKIQKLITELDKRLVLFVKEE